MNVFDLSAILRLDTTQFDMALAGTEGKTTIIGTGMQKAMKVADVALAATGSAIGAFVASSIKKGSEFDKSISQVAATMGLSMDEMASQVGKVDTAWGVFDGNLREYAQFMGKNTAFSAIECADALNYMALAGYNTQQSMDMLPNVLNLAAAGNMDLARASDMVTDTQTAFGISAERTTQMVDEMAKAASTGNTSVEQLGDAFLVVGGLAQELNGGLVKLADGTQAPVDGIQELEIALTAMANSGVKGSEAGTHMRNMLLKLSSPTAEGTKRMEALGIKVFDASGQMRSLKDVMGDLNVALGNLTQEQKIQAISELFNTRDLASAEALLGAVGQDWDKIGESILNAQGAAQKMANTQLDNLAGDVTLFKSALEGAKIAVSDQLQPSLRKFVQLGTDLLGKFTKFVTENSDSITKVVTSILDVVNKLFTFVLENAGEIAFAITAVVTAFAAFEIVSTIIPMITTLFEGIMVLIGGLYAGVPAVSALGLAFDTLAINPVVLAITALIAVIGICIYKFSEQKEAIMSVEEAQKSLEEATRTLNDAYMEQANAADAVKKAQEELTKAQDDTGLSGEQLFEEVRNGTRDYNSLSEQEQQVYKDFLALKDAQDRAAESTEKIEKATREETLASFNNRLALAKESGQYDDYKNSVVDAYRKGSISADDARELIGKSTSDMDKITRAYYMEDLPKEIRQGLNPSEYTSAKQEFVNFWEGIVKNGKTWGADFIDSLREGMGKRQEALSKSIGGITAMFSNNLGHSHPSEGPMADDYKWMPDMMDLFIEGIEDNQKRLRNTVRSTFDFKDLLDDNKITTSDIVKVETGNSNAKAGIGGVVNNYTFNQTNNSPQALTPYEIARQSRNATRNMVLSMQGV